MSSYYNIKTNNLKGLDFFLEEKKITTIFGESGSGKTSLAFSTIAKISEDEMSSLIKDDGLIGDYEIDSYEDILVAIPLQQINKNVNPFSTIATYFMLQKDIERISAIKTGLSIRQFRYNANNFCQNCNGLGYEQKIDINAIIDPTIIIAKNPFLCWKNTYKKLFDELLLRYCEEEKIDIEKKFYELKIEDQNKLLYGQSKNKYKVDFYISKQKKTRTINFNGVMMFFDKLVNESFGIQKDKFSKKYTCSECDGVRYKKNILKKQLYDGLNFDFFYKLDFYELSKKITEISNNEIDKTIKILQKKLLIFIDFCIKMNLGYLTLSRSIPSLSGGELQRLRLAHILSGKISNTLIVLDEPTASLSKYEIPLIIEQLKQIKGKNTLLIVEHNKEIKEITDRVYCLGPSAGDNGGRFINEDVYFENQKHLIKKRFFNYTSLDYVTLKNTYVNYQSSIPLYHGTFSCIVGESGSGKTTLIKDICLNGNSYQYVSQKPLLGNSRSTIGSYLGIIDDIKEIFSRASSKNKNFFTKNSSNGCKFCQGKGELLIENSYGKNLHIKCDKCQGTGYSENILEYKVNGKNIFEIMNLPIIEFEKLELNISHQSRKIVKYMKNLGLSYLCLNRKIDTLSGGENQRIKLAKYLVENKVTTFALDEPTKGLSLSNIDLLIQLIYDEIGQGKTFICVDHNSNFYNFSSYIVELKRGKGISYIAYNGKTENYK